VGLVYLCERLGSVFGDFELIAAGRQAAKK
jgi:hypothetical protein